MTSVRSPRTRVRPRERDGEAAAGCHSQARPHLSPIQNSEFGIQTPQRTASLGCGTPVPDSRRNGRRFACCKFSRRLTAMFADAPGPARLAKPCDTGVRNHEDAGCGAVVILGCRRSRTSHPVRDSTWIVRVDVDNEFSRLNPFTAARRVFYDTSTWPHLRRLIRIAQVERSRSGHARRVAGVRFRVARWYGRGNGSISRPELEQTIARMDERFDQLLDRRSTKVVPRVARDDSNHFDSDGLAQTARPAVSPPRHPACEG